MPNTRVYTKIDTTGDIESQSRTIAQQVSQSDNETSNEVTLMINLEGKTEEEKINAIAEHLANLLYERFGDDWPNHIPVLDLDQNTAKASKG